MLRSLIAPAGLEAGEDFLLSRNLTREGLEQAHANGECIWMDFVDPTKEEIKWLEGLLNLHPTVVDDLLRYDRRPTLLAYPEYLFLSLFQPQLRVDKVETIEVHCLLASHLFVTVRDTGTTSVDSAYDLAAQ